MMKLVSSIVLVLLVGLFFSCATTSSYRSSPEVPNANVVGTVQVTFEMTLPNRVIAESVKQAAYLKLLEKAKTEYQGNIDVYDITVSVMELLRPITNYARLAASGKVVLLGGGNRSTVATGVEGALARAADETLKNIPQRSKIAIVYITAQDRSTTEYIVGELEYIWVNKGYFITDRSQLDRLRLEQNFQMSGEVDDATAVSIGKFAGADIIVTGRVDGEGRLRRLRLRAWNTQTAQVVGVASERL
jgi:hypothetical protein